MPRKRSERSAQLSESRGIGIANQLLALGDRPDLIKLNDGEFDVGAPPAAVAAAREALRVGHTRYDEVQGLRALRKLICEKLCQENGIAAKADEILVTNGSSQAIVEVFLTLVDPGDEVLVPQPCWPTYLEGVKLCGGVPVPYPQSGLDLDCRSLEDAMTPRTRIVVLNTPHNPTGAVYSREALRRAVEAAGSRGIYVLADEAYERLVLDGHEHHSAAALAGPYQDLVITTQSFSKAFSMSGFRVGYVHAERGLIDALATLHGHMSDNVCTFAQHGAVAALQSRRTEVDARRSILQGRMALATDRCRRLFPCVPPAGGFYLFPDVSAALRGPVTDAPAFCKLLLGETGVAVLPGEAFGVGGHVRISVAGSPVEAILEAFDRMAGLLNRL